MEQWDERRLLRLQKEIEEAKQKSAQLEGRISQMMDTLKREWKCSTLEEAGQRLEVLKQEAQQYQEQINEGVRKVQELYEQGE